MTIIDVTDLSKRYGEVVAADRISFTVDQGEILGVLGPNGAGKTTTVECIAGLRHPDGGTIRVAGLDPVTDRDALRQVIGIQLQEALLPDQLRVGEAMELYASFYPDPADTEQLLSELGLVHARATAFRDLSGGQQQRLSIALALVGRPRIAILDELTTGLDPQARRDTWELIEAIRDAGVTVVLVSHSMEEVERLCDRLLVIDGGRIVGRGSPEQLVAEVAGTARVRLRTAAAFDVDGLRALPDVRAVSREGRWWVITGTGELAATVRAVLDAQRVPIEELRQELPTLDHAYLQLTSARRAEEVRP